jgi:TonB-like protein
MPSLASVTRLHARRGLTVSLPLLVCLTTLSLGSCRTYQPNVRQMVEPVYPVTAQSNNVEGIVDLVIQVGMDGRVLSVTEGAEGANRDLVAAAKENAQQWLWGPFPPKFQFPWYHNIRYVFKLQGKPTHFPIKPPIVRTRLPDQIEIIAIPCYKTYFDPKPAAATQ